MYRYPWLPPTEYRDHGETAANIIVPYESLEVLDAHGIALNDLGTSFRPIICEEDIY